jgi:O-antigen/teichoic acid export membrane protein
MALVAFLLRHLGEEAYGVIGVLNSILGFVLLIDMGLRPATTRQFTEFLFREDSRRANELVSSAMAGCLIVAGVLVVGSVLGGRTLLSTFGVDTALLFDGRVALTLVALSLGISLVSTPYSSALASQLRHDVQYYTEMVGSLLRAAFIVVVFSSWQAELSIWAAAALLASVASLLVMRWQSYRQCPRLELRRDLVTRRGFQDLAGFSAYTGVSQLATWLNLQSGPLVISYFLGSGAVAHYAPALVLTLALRSLSGAFLFQLQPVLTRAYATSDFALVRSVLMRSTRYSLLLSGGAALWVGALALVLVPSWLGDGFQDTSVVLMLWCANTALHACAGGSFAIFMGTGRLAGIARLNAFLATLATGLAVGLVGFWGYGVVGAALAALAAQIVRTTVYVALATRICEVGVGRYLREACAGPVVCLMGLAVTAIGALTALEATPRIEFVTAGALSLLVFAALAWPIGLNAADRAKAASYARRAYALVSASSEGRPSSGS